MDTLHDTRGGEEDEVMIESKVLVEAIKFVMKVCMVDILATGVAGGSGTENSIRWREAKINIVHVFLKGLKKAAYFGLF